MNCTPDRRLAADYPFSFVLYFRSTSPNLAVSARLSQFALACYALVDVVFKNFCSSPLGQHGIEERRIVKLDEDIRRKLRRCRCAQVKSHWLSWRIGLETRLLRPEVSPI